MKNFAISITVRVLAEQLDAFLAATAEHRRAALEEPGCLHYSVLQAGDDPCLLVIAAVFASLDDFRQHRMAAYTEHWKTATDPLLTEQRGRVGGYFLFED